MNEHQQAVEDFHRAMEQPIGDLRAPAMPNEAQRRLRASLIAEEFAETIAALGFDCDVYITARGPRGGDVWQSDHFKKADLNLEELADGIADTEYVLLGTAVVAGIDTDAVFAEVQRANMAKASGPVRADGKRLKPEGWTPPDIAGVLARQGEAAA